MSKWTTETAEWYAQQYGEYATNRLGIDALNLSADAVIVDIGCGTGSALRHASVQVTQGQLIGIDPVPRMVEIAKEQTAMHPASARIEFHIGPAESLPIDDSLADFVLAFDSFDHWQDKAQGLQEVWRVLKDEGQFAVIKDGGLPDGSKARTEFMNALGQADFEILNERDIAQDDISFKMWVCKKTVS